MVIVRSARVPRDASCLPLRFALRPGQAHDSTLAGALLDDRLPPDSFVLAARPTTRNGSGR